MADERDDSIVLNIENLISEVEKRPGLYNNKTAAYTDKNCKEQLWTEVYEALVSNWNDLEDKERMLKGNDIQRKWRNIRDSFRKEIQMKHKVTSASGSRKKRKYIYFHQLLFLLPVLKELNTHDNNATPKSENKNNIIVERQVNKGTNSKQNTNTRPEKRSHEESLLNISEEQNEDDIDEDKSFLLSLVPSFKKLSDEQKLITKMEFLNVLRLIMFSQPSSNSSNSYISPNFPSSNLSSPCATPPSSSQRVTGKNRPVRQNCRTGVKSARVHNI